MKRKILKALLAFTALALTSCSMINKIEQEDNPKSFITIGITEDNRTARPTVSTADEFTSLTLTGTANSENAVAITETTWTTDDSQSAYTKMRAANIAVTEGAIYSFILTGTKGGATWQGTASKTIEQGANALSFTLALKTISTEGVGGVNVTLSVPSVVVAAEATLKTLNESSTLNPEGASFTFANSKATYTASGIAAGNYVIIFKLFGDTAKQHELAQWREYAQITGEITSTSTPVIESADKLKSIYTVTFNSNGGSDVTAKTVTGGNKVSTPTAPTKTSTTTTNYTFAGWYTSTDGGTTLSSTAFDFTNTPITASITLYAKWTESVRTYAVTFNANGGTITTSSQSVNADTATALTSASTLGLQRTDYDFTGWNTAENGSGTSYANGASITITAPLTLYAQWEPTPLTLEAIAPGNITIKMEGKTNNTATTTAPWSTLKFRKNGGTLTAVTTDSSTNIATIQVEAGDKICLFAVESTNTYTDSKNYSLMNIGCDADCYIYGNIMSLVSLNESSGTWNKDADEVSENAFRELFKNNEHIKNHASKTLKLPATKLAKYCYSYMFSGCIGLTTAPALPATTLADWCYRFMFNHCTSLTVAPALPATTLAEFCYNNMFCGCYSLTTAPALPATTLAYHCYSCMFSSCKSLTTAPSLPATTLAESCYSDMFGYCTSLTEVPTLSATTLANRCYSDMFNGCTSLTSAPKLPATTLAEKCYSGMFKKCTSLTSAPKLPATTLAKSCYYEMFSACSSLTTAPALNATTLVDFCYLEMFEDCTSLNSITCLATYISASNCTTDWVKNVASSGTFTKKSGADWSKKTGNYGIPSGWTVEEVTEN